MFCPKCGAENEDTARFCIKCGQPLRVRAAPARRKLSWLTVVALLMLPLVFVVAGLVIYVRLRPTGGEFPCTAETPMTVQHTFEAATGIDWDTGIGLRVSIPPAPIEGKLELVVERSVPEQLEEEFIALHSVYDISLASASISQEHPPVTLTFEIPDGVDPRSAVILQWTEEGWVLAECKEGLPGGTVSSDGRHISIVREELSRYSVGEWLLYKYIFPFFEKLPEPPPPSPTIEVKEAKPSLYLGYLDVEVSLDSPTAVTLDLPIIGRTGLGGTWYEIVVSGKDHVKVEGSGYLAPGEKRNLEITFPSTGGNATVCLNTKEALPRAVISWASRLGLPVSEAEALVKIVERFQGRAAEWRDLGWVVKEALIRKFWKSVGAKAKFMVNLVPVSIDMAVYINALTDYRPDPCVEVSVGRATPAPTSRPYASKIAYVGNGGIWVIDEDGSNKELLIPSGDHPLWLPNSPKIAYTSGGEVKVTNLDGSAGKTVWEAPLEEPSGALGRAQLMRVKWSHDGKGFFAQWRWHTGALPPPWFPLTYVDLSTFKEMEVFENDEVGQFDVSSPNGQIVFVELVEKEFLKWTEALSVVDKDGKNKHRLLTKKGTNSEERPLELWGPLIKAPAWSPDGRRIAFYLSGLADAPDEAKLCVMDADGGNLHELRQVTFDPVYSWVFNGDIAWSPDGKKIAYVDESWIWIINSDGSGEPRRLVEGRRPSWALVPSIPISVSMATPPPPTPVPADAWKNAELVGRTKKGWPPVFVSGTYAYMDGLLITDVSDPTNPYEVGSWEAPDITAGIFVSGSYAYLALGYKGLWIVDISDPTAPHEVGYHRTRGYAEDVFVSGSHAYVATREAGLQVINVANPYGPKEVGVCQIQGSALSLFVSGSYAYVTDRSYGLRVIDISDPSSPYEIGACYTPGKPSVGKGIFVSGSYAYVADGEAGLRVVNISDPANPHEVGHCDTPGYARNVFVSDSCACVVGGFSGKPEGWWLVVIDVSDPAMPREMGYYDMPRGASDVFVSAPYVYVASSEGLFILRFSGLE